MSAGKPGASRLTSGQDQPPCYGVMCPMRRDCQCYRAVEAMPARVVLIATCVTPERQRPGFVLAVYH